jgi:hypothetical protein
VSTVPHARIHEPLRLPGDATDWPARRRWFLTANLRSVTRSALAAVLTAPYEATDRIVDIPEGAPLETLAEWAFTDVAWLFADFVADLGDSRQFLLDIGELDPGDVGAHRTRPLVDLRRLLAVAACAEAADADKEYFAETVTRVVAVFMGLHLAWPNRLTAHGPALVSAMLELTDRWALRPMTLGVWSEAGFATDHAPLRMPERALLVARATCHLEQTYADFHG